MDLPSRASASDCALALMPERNTADAGPDPIPTSRSYGSERVAETGTDTNWDNYSLLIFAFYIVTSLLAKATSSIAPCSL